MLCKSLIGILLLVFASKSVSAATDKIVCYYGSWAIYRPGNGQFAVEDIDPTLCTHLIYSFVGIGTDGKIKILDYTNDVANGGMARFVNLKQRSPNTKFLVAIGGWNQGSATFSTVAANPSLRATFIADAVNFVSSYHFDGFDLDWEYPALRGGVAADKANFVQLIKEFRTEFDKHGYLLTAAVAATGDTVDAAYDVPGLNTYLHQIHVMTYDLHGSYDGATGQNAPLYPSTRDATDYQKLLCVNASISKWISLGAAPAKLVLGMGVYGQTFTLATVNNHDIGDASSGPGNPGPYTAQSGFLGYNEICEQFLAGGWTIVWSEQQQVPYAYKGNQWVGYDNPQSIQKKMDFAKGLNLGGAMIWSIETEDFRGICGPKWPILSTINSNMAPSGSTTTTISTTTTTQAPPSTTTTQAPPSTTTVSSGTTAASPASYCKQEGFVRDPAKCNVFYYCQLDNGKYIATRFQCGAPLVFNTAISVCDYPENVTC